MSKRTYRFGDVVEWDISSDGREVIRWFIISGTTRSYDALCVRSDSPNGHQAGSITSVGADGGDDERLLND